VTPSAIRAITPVEGGDSEPGRGVTTTPIDLQGVVESTTIQCKIIAPASFQPVGRRGPDVEVRLVVTPE